MKRMDFTKSFYIYLFTLSCSMRLISSYPSFPIESASTKTRGTTYVNKYPTLRIGKNCVSAVPLINKVNG